YAALILYSLRALPRPALFPYTTLFRSTADRPGAGLAHRMCAPAPRAAVVDHRSRAAGPRGRGSAQEAAMSEVMSMSQAPTAPCAACPTCGRDDIEWSDARDQLIAALVQVQRQVKSPRQTGYNSH